MNSFFTWHTFLEVGKTQDLPRKISKLLEMLSLGQISNAIIRR
jgi:hypothetical protein